MRGDNFQLALIFLAGVVTLMVGVFIYRELFPEYKVYQNAYVQLEDFRAGITGEPPAAFYKEIKQILLPVANNGPDKLDRCVTCHTAMKLEHFSPTKVALDVNGHVMVDSEGIPLKVPNDAYVWKLLDDKIAQLTDPQVLQALEKEGRQSEVKDRKNEAERLASWKTHDLHDQTVDMTKVLAMHPLIGRETRPFQYHSMDQFGCTVCHSGNGRAIVTDRAHGPVFDGEYEIEEHAEKPQFLESDADNDPRFSKVFNDKPGHRLLFHTKPLLTGTLIEAQCAQCHQTTQEQINSAIAKVDFLKTQKEQQLKSLQDGIKNDEAAILSFIETKSEIQKIGLDKAIEKFKGNLTDYRLPSETLDGLAARVKYLLAVKEGAQAPSTANNQAIDVIDRDLEKILGQRELAHTLESALSASTDDKMALVKKFLTDHQKDQKTTGTIFEKLANVQKYEDALAKIDLAQDPLKEVSAENTTVQLMASVSDRMSEGYKRGQQLFLSQACHACHRISGLSKGGIGPELTTIGLVYPWYVKESIVWPDSNVEASQMPNFRLDHDEIEDLMTYLMSQKGEKKSVSEYDQTVTIKAWENGSQMPWEKPLPPNEVHDLRSSMVVFATEGCSSCHKLRGFDSNAGFKIEKGKPSFDELYREKEWFKRIFPEDIPGSQIVAALDRFPEEVDGHIDAHVRQNGLVEEIDTVIPRGVEAFYSNFKYALRAKDKYYSDLLAQAQSAAQKEEAAKGWQAWKERVENVLKVYIQEYGFGRDVGPRLHWSGIYRSEEWLVEHFRNPSSHSAKSIMPVMPFDDSKFYALSYMLQELGKKNRDETREIWAVKGFDPQQAYDIHCAACHGHTMFGNGPVAEKLYPIPKNLRNATFLRNLTKAEAKHSIVHGVKGGPMPPWGEAPISNVYTDGKPVLTENEIDQIVDWLFSSLPGGEVIKKDEDVGKWRYSPDEFIKELKQEGQKIPRPATNQTQSSAIIKSLPNGEGLYASLKPQVFYTSAEEISVDELFDEVAGTPETDGKMQYFIKKEFYTPENISAGQNFFILNCAHCHGTEGAGNGLRAAIMREAKPRMLTNLPWLRTRDDIWLLRSIKFGVPGTAMTPWGDQSSSLQRLQMVIFIRSLTGEKKDRDDLQSYVYQAFEVAIQAIDETRGTRYQKIEEMEKQAKAIRSKREQAFVALEKGKETPEETSRLYAEEVKLVQQIYQEKEKDQVALNLLEKVKEESDLYTNLGIAIIRRSMGDAILQRFFALIDLNKNRYANTNGKLSQSLDPKVEEEILKVNKELISTFESHLKAIEDKKKIFEGHLPSAERTERMRELEIDRSGLEKLFHRLIGDFERATRLRLEQKQIYANFPQGT